MLTRKPAGEKNAKSWKHSRKEADTKRKEREQEEQRTRKSLAYSRWHLDASNKFYEAVGLPVSEEYAGEYLTWMSEQMSIKQEQKPLEYFERMLPSYDEYVRERYPENLESEHGLLEQKSEISTRQQNCW